MQIQEAFEHLSDAQKRREFDSVDEFDDTLPESCASEDFFLVHSAGFLVHHWQTVGLNCRLRLRMRPESH